MAEVRSVLSADSRECLQASRDGDVQLLLRLYDEQVSELGSLRKELTEANRKLGLNRGTIELLGEQVARKSKERRELDQRIESQRRTNQGLHRSYEHASRALAALCKCWAAFCIEVLWAERLGRPLSRDAWIDERVASLVRPFSPLEVEVCERCGARAPCLPARRSSTEQRVCAWGCPEVNREEQSGALTMERLSAVHASAYVPLDPQPEDLE